MNSLLSIKKEIMDFESTIVTNTNSQQQQQQQPSSHYVSEFEITSNRTSNSQIDLNGKPTSIEIEITEKTVLKIKDTEEVTKKVNNNTNSHLSETTSAAIESSTVSTIAAAAASNTNANANAETSKQQPLKKSTKQNIKSNSRTASRKESQHLENELMNSKSTDLESVHNSKTETTSKSESPNVNQNDIEIAFLNGTVAAANNSNNKHSTDNSLVKKNENLVLNTMESALNTKYSFHIINTNLCGKQRIRHIEEQMRLCREAYAKLKNEIASIDRKKKKLKRNLLEKTSGNNNNNSSSNGAGNNDENTHLNASKQDIQMSNGNTNANTTSNAINKKTNELKV